MARKTIDIGVVGNDGTGDSIRDSFRKVNDNFRELYGALGLGSRLRFSTLEDAPTAGEGEDYYRGLENAIVAVNADESGLIFKQLVAGTGISLNFTNENQIEVTNTRSTVAADPDPRLGGNLQGQSGGVQYRIQQLATPITANEAANKAYADTKIGLGGVFTRDPAAGNVANSAFGTMTGPLILSRNPEPEDDITYGGLIAASKNYVDNAGFASVANLFVATSGSDERIGVGSSVQGRALPFAYRTLEAALKRAEELILEAPPEIGPYKKVLTWTNPDSGVISDCTLADIDVSDDNGIGFTGRVTLTIDSIRLVTGGFNYQVGEILKINATGGAAINAATVEILTVNSAPGTPNGPILTFRLLTGGKFDEGADGLGPGLPVEGISGVTVTAGSTFGTNGIFAVTYKVSTAIIQTPGTGYSLVSVRVEPSITDTDAISGFGFADVVSGAVAGITITDGGRGFTEFPNLIVSLPRFLIYTGGQRTDFTGDVTTDSAVARRGRDIREGLYLQGETSGALAQILAHSGQLDTLGNEIFDIDIKFGTFEIGETISYGDVANSRHIAVLVESGIYYENFPLKIPQNVAVIGDEFRRTIIRPKKGASSSPWAFKYFRRDKFIDGLNTAKNDYNIARDDVYGYHYLSNADEPVYDETLINNKGFYRSAADLLSLNKKFIQEEVITWINKQIVEEVAPFVGFEYNSDICKRDIGLLIDAMVFDLRYGSAPRTISASLKYKDANNASAVLAITEQRDQTIAAIRRLETVAQAAIRNVQIVNSEYLQPITGTLITYSEPQVIDTAYTAETGAGGTPVTVSAITKGITTTISTVGTHGFIDGEVVTFRNMTGLTQLNGNSYWITVATSTQFVIYSDQSRTLAINSTDFAGTYDTNSGDVIPNGGVIGRLTDVIIDIIDGTSESYNVPLDNDRMDVFLCNDAVIGRAMTIQGAGGFACVLDPEGQILAKSPYFQEGAVFSKSTGRQTFAGGMFIDGFAGNIKFRITNKISNTRLEISDLKRFPQLPASFIVDDTVYRINYVRDFEYGTAGSTATFVLDEVTPWPFEVFTYQESICNRDVGLIIDGLGYDIVFGSNYHSRRSGQSYRQANAEVVIIDQLNLTIRAIDRAHDLADENIAALTPASSYNASRAVVSQSKLNLKNIIRRGTTAAPVLSIPNPTGLASNIVNAKTLLIANIEFLKQIGTGYITTTYPALEFSTPDGLKVFERIIESLTYDLVYGGNSETRKAAFEFFNGVGVVLTLQILTSQPEAYQNAVTFVKNAAKNIILNTAVTPTYGATASQVTGSASDIAVQGEIETLMGIIVTALNTYRVTAGSEATKMSAAVTGLPAEVLPNLSAYAYEAARITARATLQSTKATIQTEVIGFVNENANVYEVLMPGNRSMLSNDFTQICDMGYGLVTANGGLAEAVSMFTYYCYTSYYSVTGGQIRSVGGSSAHGVYALAAEGSDPLEVPTPVDLYYELAQGAVVYNDGGAFDNDVNGFIIYVTDYAYPPRDGSEIEIDHGGTDGLVRYPVVTAVSEVDFPSDSTGQQIYRLNLDSDTSGLIAGVPNGTRVTLRVNTEVVLTGDVVGVAVRPSTALKLNELFDSQLYRVLEFADYFPPDNENTVCTFTSGTETLITAANHGQRPGYQVRFYTSGGLPLGLIVNDSYYIIDNGFTANTFKVSLTKDGQPIETTTAGAGSHFFVADGLVATQLKDGYNYAEMTLWPRQEYSPITLSAPNAWGGGQRLIQTATEIQTGTQYTIVTAGTTNWISIGSAANTAGTVFTATGAGTGTGTAVVTSTLFTFDHTTDVINKTGHGLFNGDVVRFDANGTMPSGVFTSRQYFVINRNANDFQIASYFGGPAITFTDNGSGYFAVAKVDGKVGDSSVAIVELGPLDSGRIVGSRLTFQGRDYVITQYDDADITGESYGKIYFNTPLEDSAVKFESPITLFAGVSARTEDSQGTLTIRISLTRVTGHDLLEIGTGSYADTNYPSEIYGSPVRIATETLLDTTGEVEYSQIVERGEGRCFFVTTDQFGNFSVGPFFRVDQGTGTVTFSASLALSNLSGLGFKRGVPIAEFSTDTTFSDNATDTVPTENAARGYIDRRLGVSHGGDSIDEGRLIPATTGGFMALTGQLPMKGTMNMDDYRIRNVADPIDPQDAVNRRSISFDAIIANSFPGQAVDAGYTIAFTGAGNEGRAVKIAGDLTVPGDNAITAGIDSTLNEYNIYIKPDIIDNANINSAAGIVQSKLSMVTATARVSAAGITQADRGLASFNDAEFTVTNGWAELKTNSIAVGKLAQVATDTVLGRSAAGTGDVSAVAFSTVVNEGGAIKKSQFSSTGFLRRTNVSTSSEDADYGIVEAVSLYTGFTDVTANSKLVVRDGSGDIGSRDIYASRRFYIGTSANVNKLLTDTSVTATGGSINVYGFSGVLGVSIGDGSLTSDKVSSYRNNSHRFRLNDDSAFAPIQVSSITSDTFTTGGSTTAGTLTGNLSLSTNSNLTLGTGTINASAGTLQSTTLTTGAVGTAGTITGAWSLSGTSKIIGQTGGEIDFAIGTIKSRTFTTGANSTTGSLTGNWSLTSGSKIDFVNGTLQSTTLTTGATATAGVITGQWSVAAGSSISLGTAGFTTRNITTGGEATTGTITGDWSMTGASNLTWGTGYLDMRTGTFFTDTITTGAAGTTGTITGSWSMIGTSDFTLGSGFIDARAGTLYADTLTTGAAATAGVITGAWTLGASSTLVASTIAGQANSATITSTNANTANTIVLRDASGNFSAGSVTVSGLNIGADSIAEYIADTVGAMVTSNTESGISVTYDDADNTLDFDVADFTITLTGDVTGTGTVTNLGSVSFVTTISADATVLGTDTTGQYASTVAVSGTGLTCTAPNAGDGTAYTITSNATSANTVATLVARDANGDFSARIMTGALSGNASTATTWATGRTITLTGDVTGVSGSFDGSGNLSFATTIAANSVALGTDTTGQYASTVGVSGNGLSCTAANADDATAYTITSNATNANTGSTIVFRDASGNFSAGTITAALSGNASTATTAAAWTTGRTITLTGDVTGVSGSFDGSGNLSFATTIAANSVELGTDTTGSYVQQGATSGNGISGSVNTEGGTFTVTSNATSANTGNTIVFRDGNGDFSARIMTGTATAARYADLAERYAADKKYEVGTVVVFGGEQEITTTNIKMDTAVAGVISANPAFRMNCEAGEDDTHPYVALAGRVPCRVAGKIKKGNILVTSGIPGVAVAAVGDIKVGSMIGKALENYDSDHIGTIEVAVGRA